MFACCITIIRFGEKIEGIQSTMIGEAIYQLVTRTLAI
jgi:hypothetical protein